MFYQQVLMLYFTCCFYSLTQKVAGFNSNFGYGPLFISVVLLMFTPAACDFSKEPSRTCHVWQEYKYLLHNDGQFFVL